MPFRSASTISPVISTLSSFCAMVASFIVRRWEGRRRAAPARRRVLREQGHVRGLLGLVLHLRTFVQRAIAAALNGAEVDEQVLATLIRGDEPITLVRVEPLDGSGCHMSFTSLPTH